MRDTGKKFVFSCYVKKAQPVLHRRPWWNLWGRDRIEYVQQWDRVYFAGLNQKQADAIIKANFVTGVWPGPFVQALGGTVQHIQLEQNSASGAYAPSEHVKPAQSARTSSAP